MTTTDRTLAPAGPTGLDARLEHARRIADTMLFEGYVLYPYRASAAKNRARWQFGVLVPPAWVEAGCEPSLQRTECLLEPRRAGALSLEVRFLRAQRRTVEAAGPGGSFRAVPTLELPDRVLVPWDEGVEERIPLELPLDRLLAPDGVRIPVERAAVEETELVRQQDATVGRLLRRREAVHAELRVRAVALDGPSRVVRLSVEVENTSPWRPEPSGRDREAALPHALIGVHVLLAADGGRFLSMTDPPEWAAHEVKQCRNRHAWPVLAGSDGAEDVMLACAIILEDHPRIAPESPGGFFDATEIDEMLALRTATLTDQEKREARGTDDRAASVVDLADSMPPEVLERLHGVVRSIRELTDPQPLDDWSGAPSAPELPWWDPAADRSVDPSTDRVHVDGVLVGAGSRVVLRPGRRRTDAQDLFLRGRTALVEAVVHDVDGTVHLAVTVEDDPGADLWREQGRFLYFQPDELALAEPPAADAASGDTVDPEERR
ncbi:hypothetical protein [Streptacidiphilus sp. EB129]|uniref:hypothetical protein n=1 Tax=Streptacidiphilus sp. EB129 TaxID=3156262 RepID=UPI003516DA00